VGFRGHDDKQGTTRRHSTSITPDILQGGFRFEDELLLTPGNPNKSKMSYDAPLLKFLAFRFLTCSFSLLYSLHCKLMLCAY